VVLSRGGSGLNTTPLVGPVSRRGRPLARHYPRMARVNELLREVLAEAIERAAGSDPRLEMATVTAVSCDPDLRHATVFLSSLSGPAAEALAQARPRLQAAVAHQVRIKRTPQLSFDADPAVAYGERVESVLRGLRSSGQLPETGLGQGGPGGSGEVAGLDGPADPASSPG